MVLKETRKWVHTNWFDKSLQRRVQKEKLMSKVLKVNI